MKDLTKFICDLISFGSQIDKTSVPTQQMMACLAGNVLAEDIPAIATLDYDAIEEHINAVRSNLAPTRLIEYEGKFWAPYKDGRKVVVNITHY